MRLKWGTCCEPYVSTSSTCAWVLSDTFGSKRMGGAYDFYSGWSVHPDSCSSRRNATPSFQYILNRFPRDLKWHILVGHVLFYFNDPEEVFAILDEILGRLRSVGKFHTSNNTIRNSHWGE